MFVGKLKRVFKKAKKKVQAWWERNSEIISGIAAIVIPVIFGAIAKKLVGLFA